MFLAASSLLYGQGRKQGRKDAMNDLSSVLEQHMDSLIDQLSVHKKGKAKRPIEIWEGKVETLEQVLTFIDKYR